MPIPINIPTIIAYAKIAAFLAADEEANYAKNQGGTIMPSVSRLIYIVRKSVEWQYGIDPTETTLVNTTLYLQALIGRYVQIAQAILGQGGGIFISPSSGSQFGISWETVQFTIGDPSSPMDDGDTVLVLSYNNPIINSEIISVDSAELIKGVSDRASYSIVYTETSITITFTEPVVTSQIYVIRFTRYTN